MVFFEPTPFRCRSRNASQSVTGRAASRTPAEDVRHRVSRPPADRVVLFSCPGTFSAAKQKAPEVLSLRGRVSLLTMSYLARRSCRAAADDAQGHRLRHEERAVRHDPRLSAQPPARPLAVVRIELCGVAFRHRVNSCKLCRACVRPWIRARRRGRKRRKIRGDVMDVNNNLLIFSGRRVTPNIQCMSDRRFSRP